MIVNYSIAVKMKRHSESSVTGSRCHMHLPDFDFLEWAIEGCTDCVGCKGEWCTAYEINYLFHARACGAVFAVGMLCHWDVLGWFY